MSANGLPPNVPPTVTMTQNTLTLFGDPQQAFDYLDRVRIRFLNDQDRHRKFEDVLTRQLDSEEVVKTLRDLFHDAPDLMDGLWEFLGEEPMRVEEPKAPVKSRETKSMEGVRYPSPKRKHEETVTVRPSSTKRHRTRSREDSGRHPLSVTQDEDVIFEGDERHHGDVVAAPEDAHGRLIRREFVPHELPSLLEAIISSERITIRKDDAQVFIDMTDKTVARSDLPSRTRNKCLKLLYRMCGQYALLPRATQISVARDRTGSPLCGGAFGDVWKEKYGDGDVAIKVLRLHPTDLDLQGTRSRFCKEVVAWKTLRHPNVLPLLGGMMSENQFAMVSNWMGNGNIIDFVEERSDVNRIKLLAGVANGLLYIHGKGMIHGDLKGANILIDNSENARIADFGLLTIVSDPSDPSSSSSYARGGTTRWMAPELFEPQQFGLKNDHRTIHSDCYALGMVIYETISGNIPFYSLTNINVPFRVVAGERPSLEEEGLGFEPSLQRMLEWCWESLPSDRPGVEEILQCLEKLLSGSEPPSSGVDEETGEESDDVLDRSSDDDH